MGLEIKKVELNKYKIWLNTSKFSRNENNIGLSAMSDWKHSLYEVVFFL